MDKYAIVIGRLLAVINSRGRVRTLASAFDKRTRVFSVHGAGRAVDF